MRTWIALFALPLLVASAAAADRDQLTVDLTHSGDQVIHVLMVQEVIEGPLPMVRIRGGKIRLTNGELTDRLTMNTDDLRVVQWLVSGRYLFRLFRNDGTVGIYRYRVLPRGQRPRKGIWLEALPLDDDATSQERIASQLEVELQTLRSEHAFLLATTSR